VSAVEAGVQADAANRPRHETSILARRHASASAAAAQEEQLARPLAREVQVGIDRLGVCWPLNDFDKRRSAKRQRIGTTPPVWTGPRLAGVSDKYSIHRIRVRAYTGERQHCRDFAAYFPAPVSVDAD
jgi:hypothetical protein